MRDDVFRKGDPRVRRLLRQRKKSTGIFAALPLVAAAAPPDTVEVIVTLKTDAPPRAFSELAWRRVTDRLYTVEIERSAIRSLLESDAVGNVELPRELHGETLQSLPAMNISSLHAGAPHRTGEGVVMGIIDFDLDFTLDDFRNGKHTRIAWFWDQMGTAQPSEVAPHGYGVEYDATTIDRALASKKPHEIVRHVPVLTHGTHVAGIAASAVRDPATGSFHGVAPDSILIFVNLGLSRRPVPGMKRTENVTNSIRVVDALMYVFEKARQMNKSCVVNMSLAQNASGHDGQSFVELNIDSLLDRTEGRAVVVAAGNDAAARVHAEWAYQAGATKDLTFTIPERTSGNCELEAWYSSRDTIRVSIRRPGDSEFSAALAPPYDDWITVGKTDIHVMTRRFDYLGGEAHIYISIGDNGTPVPKGDWTVRFEASRDSHRGTMHVWAERSLPQTHFGTDAHLSCTVGSPATARRCISVGNVTRDRTPNASSGRGPTRDGRLKPDVAAPGTDILSCYPGTTERKPMTGTSMSAPHIAGIVACLLEEDPQLTAVQIRELLIAASSGESFDPAVGFGFVDAAAALQLLREQL